MSARRRAGLLLASTLVLATSGCGGDDGGGSMKVTGNCGMGDNSLAVDKLMPDSVLEKLIGDGDYKAVGGLTVQDGKLPAAYDGDCDLQGSDGQDALRLGLVNKDDSRYAQAQQALAAGDQDGFVKVDDMTYAFKDSAGNGATRAVAVLPDRMVVLQVLKPADGLDVKATGEQLKTVVKNLESLTP
jgi:hypothetical protein